MERFLDGGTKTMVKKEMYAFLKMSLIKTKAAQMLKRNIKKCSSNDKLRYRILNDKERLIHEYPDLKDQISYIITTKKISVFNASFEEKYSEKKNKVYVDNKRHLKYLIHDNKRLYFPLLIANSWINFLYNSLCAEQDMSSPHRYLDEGENMKNVVIFDCGCAEANFTLGVIENAKSAYLFEGDSDWIIPLRATFSPWREKVHLCKGFLGNGGEGTISLKNYMLFLEKQGRLDIENDMIFIKMDVEGTEIAVLEDILPIMKRAKNMKLAVCLYHNADDEKKISQMIPEGYIGRLRKGHMLFFHDVRMLKYPYFRHGLMRIERTISAADKK